MLELANLLSSIFVTPVTELCKGWCIPALKRHIGYIYHCKENLKQLKKQVTELEGVREDVQVRVDAAEMNLEHIHEVVKAWLKEVEKETSTTRDDDETINMINTKCWCSCTGCSSRYNLGKRAKQKLVIIEKLLSDGKSFSSISEPRVISSTNPMPTNNLMSFTSRKHLRDEIMAALREDKGTNLILVHGMGGVGKTTLVTQVQEHIVNDENELFDTVVKVIVSHAQLEKIQNEIAEVLGLTVLKTLENASARANLLSERLMKKNNLVILDDLWSSLSFDEVGIPCGPSCKVIITARKRDVCPSFHNKKTITVEVLSEEDSWQLFKKSVGDLADSPVLGTTPRDVAKECGGLPLALVTLGSGLRDKGKPVWDNTLHHLRNSKIPSQKVLCSIKLSYENLEEEILKKCFLLCCLFPEDQEIRIYELMAYVMFDDQETLKQRTDGVYTMLDNLVNSCLLFGKRDINGSLYAVSMHDVIRDVAINIPYEEGNWFLVKLGRGLKHWPSTSGNGKCLRRLSLMENEISNLPDDPPELPHLLSLSLYGNTSLKEIPDSFFQRMESLATLDLRKTGISLLPSSFAFLKNLKTLYLDRCKFNQPSDVSVIGKLKKLEILSLAKCDLLSGLPEELRELTNLRLLNVESSYSRGFTIPRNVIGSLSRLEYLNTEKCKISWEFEGWGNGRNASLEEVLSLSGLRLKLKMDEGVKKFSISFSDATGILMMSSDPKSRNSLPSSKCVVGVSPPVCHPIKLLIQRVEILKVVRSGGLKSLGQIGGGFNNLKELDVGWCGEMKYLMRVEEAETERPFVALEKLSLKFLKKLKVIFVGPISIGWVDKLRDLEIFGCNEIVSIFDPSLGIQSAPNLESLKVSDCYRLKDVFNLNNNNIEEAGLISNVVTFSRLVRMELFGLENLENIWKGHNIPFGYFENLEEMEVSHCAKLRYLFSPSMARNLQNLKKLEIRYCKSMVKLISSIHQKMLIFPKLRILDIWGCGNLKQLWEIQKNSKNEDDDDDDDAAAAPAADDDDVYTDVDDQAVASILDFPALESLKVFGCKNLKRIRLTHRCTKQLKEIEVDEWRIEWEEPSDKLRLQSLFKELKSIPDIVQGVWSDNFELQLEFTTQFRKFSSSENFDRIENVIKTCVVPRFVEFLERQDLPKLQYEAAWALTNITSGISEHTQVVIDHDDAGGSPIFNEHSKLSMLRNAMRTLSEFCQGRRLQPFNQQVKLVLLALRHLIHSTDEQFLTDACSALDHLSRDTTKIHAVTDAGVIPRLVDLLLHPSDKIVLPALKTVYNIVRGDDAQRQYVLDNQVLPCLYQLLTQNHQEDIKIRACCTISKITRGNEGRIQVFIEANIFAPLVHLLQHAEFEIKKEAAEAILNATSGESREQIEYLVNQGCIKPLCDLLVYQDRNCMMVCLEGLENILRTGKENKELVKNNGVNIYAQMIDECKGLDKIRNLQSHDNNEIKEKAVKILERYWWEVLYMVQGVWSDNFELQLEFTTKFRKFSSSENFDRIDKVIKACIVPRFVEFLERQDQLQNEAARALTNITSGISEHTHVAGGSPSFNEHSKLSMLRNATLTLSEFCQGSQPSFEQVKLVLLALRHLIHSTDEQVLTYACSALYRISDRGFYNNDIIQAVIDAGVIPRLVDLFLHPSDKIVLLALRTVGKIFTYVDDAQKQYVFDNQVLLPRLYQLLTQNRDENIMKSACMTISRITGWNRGQMIQAVIEANIFAPLVHLLQHAEFEIKKEAAEAISNATSRGSREQIEYLVKQGCIKPLCDLLVYRDSDCMEVCLKSLVNIMRVGEEDKELGKNNGVNIYAQMITTLVTFVGRK